jgi:hypothetical protein
MSHRSSEYKHVLLVVLCCLAVTAIGCSRRPKNVARSVTGKVTLGGQPLPNAVISFTPKAEKGSPSYGVTDASGNYSLKWGRSGGRDIEGAQIGEHIVGISTMVEEDITSDPPTPASPEKVPFKYRQEGGILTTTVNRGSNTINFDLEPGPVEPPKPKTKAKGPQRGPKVEPGC